MKPIGVLGDLHLGRSLYGYSLTLMIRSAMYRFLHFCIKHEVKIAVALGDIFDNPRPTIEQEKIAIQWCNEFERAGINLFLINGNHDATGKAGLGSALDVIRANRFTFVNVINRPTLIKRLPSAVPYTGPPLYFLPFPCPSLYQDPEAWERAATSNVERGAITFCHLNIEGAKVGEQDFPYRGDHFNLPSKIIKLSRLVVAGHIHNPQRVGKTIQIIGAAERLRFDERNHDRYFTLIGDRVVHYRRSDALHLRQLLLDASGGEVTTEDVKRVVKDQDVKGAIVKLAPYVDELSTVDWTEVASEVYKQGADHVVVAPPKQVKAKTVRRIAKGRIDTFEVARRFIIARIKDKRERKLIYKRFKRIAG
jgi:DNA repair exonuclease SbcCD nuclease subunit